MVTDSSSLGPGAAVVSRAPLSVHDWRVAQARNGQLFQVAEIWGFSVTAENFWVF